MGTFHTIMTNLNILDEILDYAIEMEQKAVDLYTTLADKAVAKLPLYKKELDAAGDRVDNVHPLRFLETIFNEEEYKVALRVVRKKSWVWNEFITGTKGSFNEDFKIGNLTDNQVLVFSKSVGIDPRLIIPYSRAANWDNFVDTLITEIPREGEPARHDL